MNKASFDRIVSAVHRHILRKIWMIFYRLIFGYSFKKIGKDCYISPFASIRPKCSVFLDDGSVIERGAVIRSENFRLGKNSGVGFNSIVLGTVDIAEDVLIAPLVTIAGGNHGTAMHAGLIREQACTTYGVSIESDVWIGAGCVILDGSLVRRGSILGAGMIVKQETQEGTINWNPVEYRSKQRL